MSRMNIPDTHSWRRNAVLTAARCHRRHGRAAAIAGILLALACAGLAEVPARADFPKTRLKAIHPPGGRQGTTVDVTLVGTDLDDLSRLTFSHPGITAAATMTLPTEFDPQPLPVPGRMAISIAADVPPGLYDVVAFGRYGPSNPRTFAVGFAPEMAKTTAIDTPQKALDIPADATVSARAQANAADHYAVTLAAGQRVHLGVWARRLDSRMAPVISVLDPSGREVAAIEQFQSDDPCLDFVAREAGRYVVRIHDLFLAGGDDLFYRLAVSTGPVVESVFPPAARAGETARMTVIGRGLPGGSPATIDGPTTGLEQVSIDAQIGVVTGGAAARTTWRLLSPRNSGVDLVDVSGAALAAASLPAAVLAASAPVVMESDSNDDPSKPQPIVLPACLAGRFYPRGDRDWFSFVAKAGDEYTIDLYSQRLGLPTDASLLVESVTVDAEGHATAKQVAFADDGPAEFQGATVDRPAHDPTISFKAPTDGMYRVLVRELGTDSQSSVGNAYVLDVRRPEPDFSLLVLLAQPDRADANKMQGTTPALAVGGMVAIDVLVVKHDGFAEDLTLEAEGLPAGVVAQPIVVPARSNRGVLVLAAAEGTPPFSGTFQVVGRAQQGGIALKHAARAATLRFDVEAANRPHVLREIHDIPLAVTADVAPLTVVQHEPKTWETARGGRLSIPFDVVHRAGAKGSVSLTAANLPAELKVAEIKIEEQAATTEAAIDIDPKLPSGAYSVVLRGVAKMAYARNPQAAERARGDATRIAALAKDRAAAAEAARQEVANAETRISTVQSAGQPVTAELAAAKVAAAKAAQEATATATAAEAERVRREKVANDAAAASGPKDIDVPIVLSPITVIVTDAPISLSPTPETALVKANATVDLTFTVVRKYGFVGPVTLETSTAAPIAGVSVAATTIPPEETKATVKITTTAATPAGRHELIVKGSMTFFERGVVVERRVPFVVEAQPAEQAKP